MTRNADYVKAWRKKEGTLKHNEKYSRLREYGVPSTQACKMKYWSEKRIMIWLIENNYLEIGVL